MDSSKSTSTSKENGLSNPLRLEHLPTEILQNVFSYLRNYKDLVSVRSVCKRLQQVTDCSALWNDVEYSIPANATHKEITENLRNTPLLQNVKVNSCNRKNGLFIINSLIKFCDNVRKLDLTNTPFWDFSVLEKLVTAFPGIQALTFTVSEHLCKEYIEVLSRCKELEMLKFNPIDFGLRIKVDMKPLAHGCLNLIQLDIKDFFCSATDLNYLLSRLPNLRSLSFSSYGFQRGSTISFPGYLQYVSCDLHGIKYPTIDYIRDIDCVRELKGLGLRNNCGMEEQSLIDFFEKKASRNFKKLDLRGYNYITVPLVKALVTYFPNLTSCCLTYNNFLPIEALAGLAQLIHLEELQLTITPFLSSYLKVMMLFERLRRLELVHCGGLKMKHIRKILSTLPVHEITLIYNDDLPYEYTKVVTIKKSVSISN